MIQDLIHTIRAEAQPSVASHSAMHSFTSKHTAVPPEPKDLGNQLGRALFTSGSSFGPSSPPKALRAAQPGT